MSDDGQFAEARAFWNEAAATFDDEADHGLRDPLVRQQWIALFERLLPTPPGDVLDVGCGTGSLSVLLAERGYRVTGIDFSPAMVARARAKAAETGVNISFHVQNAAAPAFPTNRFLTVLCRHVLWALPERTAVLERWAALLAPGGSLILIEGFWHTGGGLHADEVVGALPPVLTDVVVEDLSRDPILWGADVSDERFVVRATLQSGSEQIRA